MSTNDLRFRRLPHFLIFAAILMFAALLLLPLTTVAKGGGGFSQPITSPIWNIFKDRTDKSVYWRTWRPNKRFAIYNAGTQHDSSDDMVLDRETRLVWQRQPSSQRIDWWIAQDFCLRFARGGRYGWRLATITELATLLDDHGGLPPLPTNHPFENIQAGSYFSTTIIGRLEYDTPTGAPDVWVIDFSSNPDAPIHGRWVSAEAFVWCVRGDQGRQN